MRVPCIAESVWTIPKELQELKEKLGKDKSGNGSAEKTEAEKAAEKSALEAAMAATLAAYPKGEKAPPPQQAAKQVVFKDKKEAMEALKALLREKKVPSTANWEAALKLINKDTRWEYLSKLNEKKQVFNAYKIQKQKEEKEETRLKQKRAKEAFEEFLMNNEHINSAVKYYRLEDMFADHPVWKAVPDADRREIFVDCQHNMGKREKEAAKALRKKNTRRLADILDRMTAVKFNTTWEQAQQMLLDNPAFADDDELLAMDKEDALIVFEDHVRELEKEEEEEREKERKRIKRQQRKCRDAFEKLSDELHLAGKLTSMSLWTDLYAEISGDVRFSQMLGQPGSTPLDLFKFYVEELKSRYYHEKKIIKEILKENSFEVAASTTFKELADVLCADKRSSTLDAGNVKLTYNALLEKAEAKEKERNKEEAKKLRKLENACRSVLADDETIDENSVWEDVRPRLETHAAFEALSDDSERQRVFKEFQRDLVEACTHTHSRKKSKKKSKKRQKSPTSSSDEERVKRKKSKKSAVNVDSELSNVSESDSLEHQPPKKASKKKSKKRRHKEKSESRSPISSDSEFEMAPSTSKKKKKSKKRSSTPTATAPAGDVSMEEGEISEEELQQKRRELLQELSKGE